MRRRFWWRFTGALAGAIGLGVLLYFFSPVKYALYPRCAFYSLTGLQCPGCGGLRCLHHLLHGELATAFAYNPLLIILLPVGLILLPFYLVPRACGRPTPEFFQRPFCLWLLLVVLVGFGILRNLITFASLGR